MPLSRRNGKEDAVSVADLALLAACAVPEARLRAGLSELMAACMAERMVDRLSLAQLRRMADLPYVRDERTMAGFLHRVRALRDREILTVSSAAAAICATRRLATS